MLTCYVSIFYYLLFLMSIKQARVHLLDTQPFEDAFGPKKKRRRPNLLASDYESLLKRADGSQGNISLFASSRGGHSYHLHYL